MLLQFVLCMKIGIGKISKSYSGQIYTNRKWQMDMTNQEGSQGLTSPNLLPRHQVNQVKGHIQTMHGSLFYVRFLCPRRGCTLVEKPCHISMLPSFHEETIITSYNIIIYHFFKMWQLLTVQTTWSECAFEHFVNPN